MAKDAERRKRNAQVCKEAGFDAIVCGQATEVLLLSGFWPVLASSVAVMTADGDVRVIVPKDESELAKKSCGDVELIEYEPAGLETLESPAKRLREHLGDVVHRLKLNGARVGLQLEEGVQPASYACFYQFRNALHSMLKDLLPEATFAACDRDLETLKAAKTEVELDMMRLGSAIAGTAFRGADKLLRAGRRETEVAAEMQTMFETAPLGAKVERSYGYFFCMSGPNSATASAAYARTRQRKLETGDLVMIHANTCADGFWTDITRTYTVGAADARQQKMRAAVDEARHAAHAAIAPGVECRTVDAAARDVMRKHGLEREFRHPTGHGVGFAAANADGLPRIHPLSARKLERGMTFNVEPAAYFDGYGGMRHCDVVGVTASGVELLTNF